MKGLYVDINVFPAYVGMSPGGKANGGIAARVPRIRGDEPTLGGG